MKIGMMVGMVCAAMLACGDGERLRVVEHQVSVGEERLAAYEKAAATAAAMPTPTATARYECNMKIATAMILPVHLVDENDDTRDAFLGRGEEVEAAEIRRDFIEKLDDPVLTEWAESSGPLLRRYTRGASLTYEIEEVIDDIRGGEC